MYSSRPGRQCRCPDEAGRIADEGDLIEHEYEGSLDLELLRNPVASRSWRCETEQGEQLRIMREGRILSQNREQQPTEAGILRNLEELAACYKVDLFQKY